MIEIMSAAGPLVSVCLPVYNGERFLAAAIQCILAQSYQNWELLIADDQSSDGSRAIAEALAAKDSRIRYWVNEKRLGLFENYNETLRQSKGTYIKTFAQDDLLEPEAISAMVKVLEDNSDVALVSSARQWIDGQNKRIDLRAPFPRSMKIPSREVLTFNLINLNNWVGEPSTVMFRASAKGDGFNPLYFHYGDIEYWFRVLSHGQYYFLQDVLCSFRRHEGSQTDKNHRELYFALDILRLSYTYRHVLADIEPDEIFKKRLAETVATHLKHLYESGLDSRLYADAFLGAQASSDDKGKEQGFRLLAAIALESLTHSLAEIDHEKRCRADENARFAAEVEKMQNSLYWKLTSPLRSVKNAVKGSGRPE